MQSSPSHPRSRQLLPIERWALFALLGLAVVRLTVAGLAPLSSDEAYYWLWTRPLRLSYFDHPAMVALWIWPGVKLLGDTALGVRLAAVLGSLATSIVIWDAARLAFSSRTAGAVTALWLNAALLFAVSGVVMTPDVPLLFFWALALWALIRLVNGGNRRYFYVLGLALGLGAASKYTIALILPGLAATVLLFPGPRRWLATIHLWLAALLALACTMPVLLWNAENRWASFAKQLGHAFATEIPDPARNLMTFLSGQAGLVTPLVFLFSLWGMGWALLAGWRRRRADWFLLGAVSLPILVFFTLHTQSGVVQAHWAGPAYLGGMMAAVGGFLDHPGRRRAGWFRAAPAVGAVMVAVVYFQAATALLPLPPRIDALKRLGGWDTLAAAVEMERRLHPGSFLFTQKHEPTGPVSFHLPDHAPVFQEGHIRPSYYDAADVLALKGKTGIFITRARDDGARDLAGYFDSVTFLRSVDMRWGGRPADAYNLYLAEGYRGGLFVYGPGYDGEMDAP